MTASEVGRWVAGQALTASDVDCATTVMLKILDGKCKMGAVEKEIMARLYEAIKNRPGLRFGDDFHALIAAARGEPGDAIRNVIYEQRVFAETALSRPVMKAFKAMLRQQGLFAGIATAETDE